MNDEAITSNHRGGMHRFVWKHCYRVFGNIEPANSFAKEILLTESARV